MRGRGFRGGPGGTLQRRCARRSRSCRMGGISSSASHRRELELTSGRNDLVYTVILPVRVGTWIIQVMAVAIGVGMVATVMSTNQPLPLAAPFVVSALVLGCWRFRSVRAVFVPDCICVRNLLTSSTISPSDVHEVRSVKRPGGRIYEVQLSLTSGRAITLDVLRRGTFSGPRESRRFAAEIEQWLLRYRASAEEVLQSGRLNSAGHGLAQSCGLHAMFCGCMLDLSDVYELEEGDARRAVRADLIAGAEFEGFRFLRSEWFPSEAIKLVADAGVDLMDVMGTTSRFALLLSSRLLSILQDCEFTGWSSVRVDLRGRDGRAIPGYQALVIPGRCGPIDRSLSPSTVDDRGLVSRLGMRFSAETWDGSDFFAPADRSTILVTSRVRDEFRRASVSNVRLTRVTEIVVREYGKRN